MSYNFDLFNLVILEPGNYQLTENSKNDRSLNQRVLVGLIKNNLEDLEEINNDMPNNN